MKFNKKMPIVLAGLSAVALGSVGFASWVISGTTGTQTPANVTATVGELKDQRITATLVEPQTIKSIDFDFNAEGANSNITNGDAKVENLTTTIKIKITAAKTAGLWSQDALSLVTKLKIDMVETGSTLPDTTYCVRPMGATETINLIAGAEDVKTTTDLGYKDTLGTRIKVTTDAKTEETSATLNITFNYAWGSKLGYKNPSNLEPDKLATEYDNFKNIANAKWAFTFTPLTTK